MAYIDFDPKTNSIRLVKGLVTNNLEMNEIVAQGGAYSIFKDKEKDEFKGIKLNDYLSDLELKGAKAENLFKSMLDENDVPFLYIGQGPLGLERSNVLKDKMKSKRPDFLVNLPDMGILFFDVKCRQKKGFPTSSKTYFQLFKNEIIGLINLHEQLLVPVWIAFVDEYIISDDSSTKPEFYLVPISVLKKYYDQLKANLSERENEMLTSVRIPDELLYEVKDKFAFKVGMTIINPELAITFAKSYKGLIRRIEDKIKDCIRTNSVLKSNLSQTIIKDTSKYAFRNEVETILSKLISEKVIEYEPKRPLALMGE
jgi:hypothetical protein